MTPILLKWKTVYKCRKRCFNVDKTFCSDVMYVWLTGLPCITDTPYHPGHPVSSRTALYRAYLKTVLPTQWKIDIFYLPSRLSHIVATYLWSAIPLAADDVISDNRSKVTRRTKPTFPLVILCCFFIFFFGCCRSFCWSCIVIELKSLKTL